MKKNIDYLKGFGNAFLCHRTNNVIKCGQFLSGLLHDCNRICSTHSETDGSEIKYSLCYSIEEQMSLKTALYRQMQRY